MLLYMQTWCAQSPRWCTLLATDASLCLAERLCVVLRFSQKQERVVTGALARSKEDHSANHARAADLVTAKDEAAVKLPPHMPGFKIVTLKCDTIRSSVLRST